MQFSTLHRTYTSQIFSELALLYQCTCIFTNYLYITVKDGRKITQNVLGEHKVITTEQQFLGVILSFFMHLRWPWLLRLFAVLL